MDMNIAIFTPSRKVYSETFIQAHKRYLKGNISYYYGPRFDKQVEGCDTLVSKRVNYFYTLIKILFKKPGDFVKRKSIIHSLKKNNIDVILVEYGTHAHEILSLIAENETPMVVHFHGYDASMFDVVSRCNSYKEVFSYASKVIAVSRKMEEMLLDMGCPREKLMYNVYGPQIEFEKVVPTFKKKQFIGIGRFTDKKAPYYTILAFKDVVEKHPDARLLLAGDGLLLNSCQNLIKYYCLEKNVKLIGVIKPEEFRDLLKVSLAFVQHSIRASNGDMEGTPLAVLEASVAGLPVISTIHAGIPDVIIHGQTGLLSPEHDVKKMASHMLCFLDNIELAKQFGVAGKLNVSNNFNIKRHIDSLQLVLENSIK
ncbi:MAG: colanic acid/amylovoran biosynthesis glycosyltransferase [Sediminicola sp.]|jgi:glycosyltransferase involved in cell wall biosynthesis